MIFQQGKNTPLNMNPGTLPDMSETLTQWMQPMVFGIVSTTVVNSQVIETVENINFQGVMQPLELKKLKMKPEGQTNWKWYQLHAQLGLELNTDMVVNYQTKQYRVMALFDYKEYGYIEYHLVEDYSGSGPEEA